MSVQMEEDVSFIDSLSGSEEETIDETESHSFTAADKAENAKVFEKDLKYEIEQVNAASKKLMKGDLKSTIEALACINSSFQASYQDILPMVIDGRKFLIDGDSLLMLALSSKGLSLDTGGTTLHVIYIVEIFLSIFRGKGLNFAIIFFEVWDQCWSHFPDFNVARCALKLHFSLNQKFISVLSIKSLWSEQFSNFIQSQRPGFIMTSTSLPIILKMLVKSEMEKSSNRPASMWLHFVLYSQAVCCEFLCLDVVDIGSVHSTSISLMAMVHVHMNAFKHKKKEIFEKIETMIKIMPAMKREKVSAVIFQQSMRMSAFMTAIASILKKKSGPEIKAAMKIMLVYATLIEYIPLKKRCFTDLPKIPENIHAIILQFQRELLNAIDSLSNECAQLMDFSSVGDLWHGRFFQAIFHSICQPGGLQSNDLGNLAIEYEQLVEHVNKLLQKEQKLDPYPVRHISRKCMCTDPSVKAPMPQVYTSEQRTQITSHKLIPTTCKLTALVSGHLVRKERFSSINSFLEDTSKEYLHEIRHWHSKLPMTDEFGRSKVNPVNNRSEGSKRYAQSPRNTMARYLTIYGLSLEGRSSAKAIVTKDVETNQNPRKKNENKKGKEVQGKLSKKDKIIEENLKRRNEEKKTVIKERLECFSSNFAILMQKGCLDSAVEKCDIELRHASLFSEFVLEILFHKAKACWEIWKIECNDKLRKQTLRGAKDLFLVVREILTTSEKSNWPLSSKQKNYLSTWLCSLGFKEMTEVWRLPAPIKIPAEKYKVGMNFTDFQLAHLGADLVRDYAGEPDLRVDGFIPDPWQVELFDIIDKNQSAVVVAPTSSGKTYASYYCMEKVIRESDDGVVVYVCPTKALVNQVQATIYARFKKNLPPGKALIGVFTRDHRENAKNCQILITVPECMEILLLSPRSHTWTKLLKYVIFDEVHCLAGQSGGLSWENSILLIRCPFLALSATIHEPESFCSWLRNVEDFKKMLAEKFGLSGRSAESFKVNLVIHSERHNHLKKSILFGDGSLETVHPYSFLDPTTIEECKGIPQHITLSPDESLELYNAMQSVIPLAKSGTLQPIEFFKDLCPKGFLSMHSVRKFSEQLRITLEGEPMESLVQVLKTLEKVDFSMCETGNKFVYENITVVLDSLRCRNMLPAIVFTYNRGLLQAMSVQLLEHLRLLDDFNEDHDMDKNPYGSDTEKVVSKKGNKQNRRYQNKDKTMRALGILRGPSMLKSKGSVRGEGSTDEKVVGFIEHRLIKIGLRAKDTLPCLLRRGLGMHFAGMNKKERSAVEMLFRLKIVNFVSATGTLALGIHMPCKTVVVAGDSPYLNSLEFNQMSGRAGRRGFDKEGNVVLFGLNKRKMQTLTTANLPKMVGNFPLNASLILRLLLLVNDVTFEGEVTPEASSEALVRAYALIEKSLLYESQQDLKEKMQYYFLFVNQFLIRQGLLSKEGIPYVGAKIITHIHYHEPGNFAFYYLLRSGVLEKMCPKGKKEALTLESLEDLLIVLSVLFAPMPLSGHLLLRKRVNSVVLLPPLPKVARKALTAYNKEVLQLFSHYFECITADVNEKYGEERNLPLSQLSIQPKKLLEAETPNGRLVSCLESKCVNNYVCSVFAGLSGNTDQDLFPENGEIMHIRDDINVKIVPTIELNHMYNSYALDFFRHGIKEAISRDNGLNLGADFHLLKDFLLTMKAIHLSLTEMLGPDTKLVNCLGVISKKFSSNFNKAYGIAL